MSNTIHSTMLTAFAIFATGVMADEKDVRREIQEHLHSFDAAEIMAADEFSKELEDLQVARTKGLKEIAQKAVAAGDAVGARAAWLEVLRADKRNPDAIQFFTTFGGLQKAIEDLNEDAKPQENREPKSRKLWITETEDNGKFVRFRHLGGKRWMQYFYDGKRWPCTEIRRADGFIELSNDQMDQLFRLHDGKYYQSDRVTVQKKLWADGEEGHWASETPK